jgi:hypothetical protein
MKKYVKFSVISATCLLFVSVLFLSRWAALTIGLIILGGFNYVEKIFKIEITRTTRIALLVAFIIFSGGNILYVYHKETSTREKVDKAERTAAEAKLSLEKFKAPRTLSPRDQQLIISKVSKFAGQEYLVTTYWDLKEALDFSNQLHHTLLKAGWKYMPPGEGGSFLLGGVAGVQVWVHPEADISVKNAANALVSALDEVGQAPILKLQNPKNPKDNRIHLNIGTKP